MKVDRLNLFLLALCLLLCTGCSTRHARGGGGSDDDDSSSDDDDSDGKTSNEWTDEFVQQPAAASDVLFVIDDSCSMEDGQEQLANGFTDFLQFFVEGTANDYHIGVVRGSLAPGANEQWGVLESVPTHGGRWIDSDTGASPQDKIGAFAELAQVGTNASGECEMGLQASQSALTDQASPGAPNAGFYREDALLSVIVVSDEIDHGQDSNFFFGSCGGIAPKDFISWFLYDLKGPDSTDKVFFTGIIGDRPGGCVGPLGGSAEEGVGYWDVIDGVGGAFLSICSDDWSEGLALAGLQAVGLQTSFPLTHMPVEETLVVTVDDVAPGATSWSYDIGLNAIQFATEVPMESSVIRVEYERTPGD
jgi:hypothetical protein